MSELLELLIPYVKISKEIIVQESYLNSESKARIAQLEAKFNEDAKALVYELLKHMDTSGSDTNLANFLSGPLEELKDALNNANHDASDTEINIKAIERTAEKLTKIASKQQNKGSIRRKIEHFWWAITIAVIVTIVFGVRLYSAVPTYDQIETREELSAGYIALQKIERYDDWADTHTRKGGWLKDVFLWPIEPTSEEIEFAGSMLWFVVGAHDYAISEGLICNGTLSSLLENQDLDTQLEYVHIVGEFVEISKDKGNSAELIIAALSQKFPCE